MDSGQPNKKQKVQDASSGFNAATDVNNLSDLTLNSIPILPRDCKNLLLDIEGCTTAISFVHDVLFPFAKNNVQKYLKEEVDSDELKRIADSLVEDLSKLDPEHPSRKEVGDVEKHENDDNAIQQMIVKHVHALMNHDVKATGLKSLQGKVWKAGYDSGELKGHVYEDFKPVLDWCSRQGVSVNIYSSGSIGAQKLLFGCSTEGNLCLYFNSHFDTTSGGKKESQSYKNIAKDLGVEPKDICFVSDAEEELVAAREAGIGFPVMSVRPGNKPLSDIGRKFPLIFSLLQICGSGK
jgi:2,3-diketo-5-methylthio-1-phosphopentane phosphatase